MIEALDAFFESVAWPMDPPTAYGAFHVLFTLSGFTVCGYLAWRLRNVSNKAAGLILFFCGLVWEVWATLYCVRRKFRWTMVNCKFKCNTL